MEGISHEQNILSAADDSCLNNFNGMGRVWARTKEYRKANVGV